MAFCQPVSPTPLPLCSQHKPLALQPGLWLVDMAAALHPQVDPSLVSPCCFLWNLSCPGLTPAPLIPGGSRRGWSPSLLCLERCLCHLLSWDHSLRVETRRRSRPALCTVSRGQESHCAAWVPWRSAGLTGRLASIRNGPSLSQSRGLEGGRALRWAGPQVGGLSGGRALRWAALSADHDLQPQNPLAATQAFPSTCSDTLQFFSDLLCWKSPLES